MRQGTGKYWYALILYALAYGLVMLSLDGIRLYEQSPYHRYQAEALLHGHFYLADSIEAIQPGLAWHDGHVQHVWGLGVGLWLLPFDALWHLFSGQPLPDRIVLGITFALLAFYSGITGLKLIRQGQRTVGLGVMWFVALCPALWTLSRASQLVFEETVLYSTLFSLGVLVSIVRVASFGSRSDYFLCCILSAFEVWVRPTHAVYGLSAVLIGSFIVWTRRQNVKDIAFGCAGWLVSLALLAWTNYARFGSPTEFGHHLTISSGNMMYLTRFGNPFREASTIEAAKELFSLLFLANPRGGGTFADDLIPGQSPFTRWRRLDLTAFDFSYAVICLAAIIGSVIWLIRQRKQGASLWKQPQDALVFVLLVWSGISAGGLSWFYLYYPAIASRYLFDFAPALTGFVMLAWVFVSVVRWKKFFWPLLAAWLVFEVISAKVPVENPYIPNSRMLFALPHTREVPLENFNGIYAPTRHPVETKIAGNGYGWEPETGFAADVLSLAIDNPEFVELRVSQRRASNGEPAKTDVYRAQIDGISLPLTEVIPEEQNLKITFKVPSNVQAKHQIEMLFLCFSDGYDAKDRNSERFLYSVRWR